MKFTHTGSLLSDWRLGIKLMTGHEIVTLGGLCKCGCGGWLVGTEDTWAAVRKKTYDRIRSERERRGLPTEVIM